MRWYVVLLAAIAGTAITACAMVVVAHDRGVPAPVYSLAAIDRQLGSDPPRRLRQPVWVRAIAESCWAYMAAGQAGGERCMDRPPLLVDATDGAAPALPLVQDGSSGPPTWLSGLPVLRHWLLRSQTPRWNQVAVYRVHLVQIPFDSLLCRRRPCYGAQLASLWN